MPNTRSLRVLSTAAQRCEGCGLYRYATQAVLGEGRASARIVLVGEQPGDQEDRQGHPFVGPAGKILDRALADAGIDRADAYLTNAVKHFKWEPRGKRRIHKKPRVTEMRACRPWLDAELGIVKPAVVVCLGATAAHSFFGAQFKLMQQRGKLLHDPSQRRTAKGSGPGSDGSGLRLVATIHPSAVLRAPDEAGRKDAFAMLVSDLKLARRALE